MYESLILLYESTFLASLNAEAFTLGALLSVIFTFAILYSSYLMIFKKESASHFITISFIGIYFLICSFITDYAVKLSQIIHIGDLRFIYLVFAVLNFLVGKLLYILHNLFCGFKSDLLHSSIDVLNLMAIFHLFIWLKVFVFDLGVEAPLLNVLYSFSIMYLSVALAITLLFPSILNTRLKILVNPMPNLVNMR